jgi:2-polyprenyl-3-methyl-5-hydroxy-6-metoxy-1,4-benzoquinol methylase
MGVAVEWTNDAAIRQWSVMPREALDRMEPEGDFSRRHLLNATLLHMLGHVDGVRVLDAGCGHGYFCRMLANRGAEVVGVEPAQALFDYAVENGPGIGTRGNWTTRVFLKERERTVVRISRWWHTNLCAG